MNNFEGMASIVSVFGNAPLWVIHVRIIQRKPSICFSLSAEKIRYKMNEGGKGSTIVSLSSWRVFGNYRIKKSFLWIRNSVEKFFFWSTNHVDVKIRKCSEKVINLSNFGRINIKKIFGYFFNFTCSEYWNEIMITHEKWPSLTWKRMEVHMQTNEESRKNESE